VSDVSQRIILRLNCSHKHFLNTWPKSFST